MNSRAFQVAVPACAFALVASSLLMLWYLLFEESWLTYPVVPFPVIAQPVKAGEIARLSVTRCNSSNQPRTYLFAHTLVSLDRKQQDVVLDPKTSTAPPGCQTVESRVNLIPADTAPGVYHIVGATEINGTLRSFSVLWVSAPFEVIAR